MMERCVNLRWKSYSEACDEAEFVSVCASNRLPYTCLRTCQPWGIDGEVAAPETCHSRRACFKAAEAIAEPVAPVRV